MSAVRYLIFDTESVADGELVSRLRYPGQARLPADAVRAYRDELMAKYESDFIPYTFQMPVSVVVGKVGADFCLTDLVALDEPDYRSHVITEKFWRGWERYDRPTLVSFNGRTFDIPLLELAAFRYGLSIPGWFNVSGRSFEQPRNRYNDRGHIDLQELLTNYGSTRFTGGLNLAANILGKPGKMDVQGDMVQDLFNDGQFKLINDYCRCDVLDTYFVFLRSRVLLGQLTLVEEQKIVDQTRDWIQQQTSLQAAFQLYLDRWGDWRNPWADESAGERPTE